MAASRDNAGPTCLYHQAPTPSVETRTRVVFLRLGSVQEQVVQTPVRFHPGLAVSWLRLNHVFLNLDLGSLRFPPLRQHRMVYPKRIIHRRASVISMHLIQDIPRLRERIAKWRRNGRRIGLVPTMGNLHDGHLALVRQAMAQADRVVVSLFVNPLQFTPNEDFERYPRTLELDRAALESVGAHCLFAPDEQQVYPRGRESQTRVEVPDLSEQLCGASRPGFFQGVATVVTKLFGMVQPDLAVFGEKDYQQLLVIRRLVADLNLPIEIIAAPIVREPDGLAMSSRNAYLTPMERESAPALYQDPQARSRGAARRRSDRRCGMGRRPRAHRGGISAGLHQRAPHRQSCAGRPRRSRADHLGGGLPGQGASDRQPQAPPGRDLGLAGHLPDKPPSARAQPAITGPCRDSSLDLAEEADAAHNTDAGERARIFASTLPADPRGGSMSPSDIREPDTSESARMEQLILDAVHAAHRFADPRTFLNWARRAIPLVLDMEEGLPIEEQRRLAGLLGVAIWNATPFPDHDWQPNPVPEPAPQDPCLCGSGEHFADCCGAAGELPEIPVELVWELLLLDLSDADIRQALAARAIPSELYARLAERWIDANRPRRAVGLLEPLFRADLGDLDPVYEPALDRLCDAYDLLEHHKKRDALLDRVTRDANRTLKAAAWQRISTNLIDEGDLDRATAAFVQAQRHGPDSPGTALVEITLLASRHHDDHARARALFWRHRLIRAGKVGEPIIDFLEQAAQDPQAALLQTHAAVLEPSLIELHAWVEGLGEQPLRAYRLAPADDPPPAPPGQLSLFPEHALPMPKEAARTGERAALQPPGALASIERQWHQALGVPKPHALRLTAVGAEQAWEHTGWLTLLTGHAEAGNSIDILDDVATVLYDHPESSLPWISNKLMRPLLERAEAIIDASLADAPTRTLPWSDERNRPALRMLLRRWLQHVEEGEHFAGAAVLERLLQLNPADHHGIRAELMNHYLRQDQDEQALALAHQFPGDRLADLAYGEVLAWFRLGEAERAAQALQAAVGRLPSIPWYLTRRRVKRPTLTADDTAADGEGQAWLYREAMGDIWAAEPGLLAWMKRHTA
jgi:pantoate--beta-alanine ligase